MSDDAPTSASHFSVEDRGDHLYVKLVGTFENVAMMRGYIRGITEAMTPAMDGSVIFDNREATQASADIRAELWTWVSSTPTLRRAAVVAHTARVQRRVKRTAELNRVRLVPFDSLAEAEAWLRA